MDTIFIKKLLKELKEEQKYELFKYLIEYDDTIYTKILEWIKKNEIIKESNNEEDKNLYEERESVDLNDKLVMKYWWQASDIISEFNQYGGGPYDEEDAASEALNNISEILEDGNVSDEVIINLLDKIFIEYNKGNSGFEDELMDLCYELCESKEHWSYLVKKLREYPTDWRNTLVMRIYKNYLHNDEAYLELRKSKLEYGMDYWDLAEFYINKDNILEAVKICEEGSLKGRGRLGELFFFLFDYYAEKDDISNMKRIIDKGFERRVQQEQLLVKLYEYYKKKDIYKEAKEALISSCRYTYPEKLYEKYYEIRNYINQKEWLEIEGEILPQIDKNNHKAYLKICMDKNMKEKVIDSIVNPPQNKYGNNLLSNYDEFAEKLKQEYPKEIIEYYYRTAFSYIENGNRKTYKTAVEYLEKAKEIYINILKDEERWLSKILEIKSHYSRRRAFLDEARGL